MKLHKSHSISPLTWMIFVAVFLASCSAQNQKGTADAVSTPLSDLNLISEKIPDVLVEAKKSPYVVPANKSCTSIDSGIRLLDEALGSDIDATKSKDDPSLLEKGTDAAGSSVVNALDSTVKSVIPFRGWFRKLSGAERHSNLVAASIDAGKLRRAFLKGFRASKGCS